MLSIRDAGRKIDSSIERFKADSTGFFALVRQCRFRFRLRRGRIVEPGTGEPVGFLGAVALNTLQGRWSAPGGPTQFRRLRTGTTFTMAGSEPKRKARGAMAKKALQCPSCLVADDLRRSHMRWHDWPLRLMGLRPYRCLACNTRFHTWARPPARRRPAEAHKTA